MLLDGLLGKVYSLITAKGHLQEVCLPSKWTCTHTDTSILHTQTQSEHERVATSQSADRSPVSVQYDFVSNTLASDRYCEGTLSNYTTAPLLTMRGRFYTDRLLKGRNSFLPRLKVT